MWSALPNSDVTEREEEETGQERKSEEEQEKEEEEVNNDECVASTFSCSTLLIDDLSSMSIATSDDLTASWNQQTKSLPSSQLSFEIEISSHNAAASNSAHGYQYLSENRATAGAQNVTLDVALERIPVGKFHHK
jgi:hypothetical protein